MTHVVTGGAGFVASHLVDALVARGEKVRVVDNFVRGEWANLSGAIETGLVTVKNLNLETGGIPLNAEDVVWHFAAKVAGIEYNRQHQYDMLRTNLIINYNVIESVRRQKPRLFVFVSTACVYPDNAPIPTPESAGDVGMPNKANHGYGVAKWTGEQMVRHMAREYDIPCIIVRFFNVFGERDHYDPEGSHVAPALIKRVLDGENPVKVWGSGKQTRVLVDAKDIAKALLLLHDRVTEPGASYSYPVVVNVGHEHEISIAELVDTIVKACGTEAEYEFDTTKPDGNARRAADTTWLRTLIDWVPDRPLGETIAEMVAEYRG